MFEWDQAKAEANDLKHGVDFVAATDVFGDPSGIEKIDPRGYDEERTRLIGMGAGALPTVVFTERGESVRIISARRAAKLEHDRCYIENSRR